MQGIIQSVKDLLYNEVSFSWFSFNFFSRVLPLEGSSDRVRGYCYSYAFLWRGLKIWFPKFKPGCFSSFSFSRHVSWESSAIPHHHHFLAGLVQPWQQLNFSPCPAAQSGSRCQSSGEGGGRGGGMLGCAVETRACGWRLSVCVSWF